MGKGSITSRTVKKNGKGFYYIKKSEEKWERVLLHQEKFEDAKGVIRCSRSKTDNAMSKRKRTKRPLSIKHYREN